MKVYSIHQKQFLPISMTEAWDFFSDPGNLAAITPAQLGFKIKYISGEGNGIYPGQIIRYKLKILPATWVTWVTEITHVQKPNSFVDEQRFGPYALWHHQHRFREVQGGVEMTDEVNYAIPFGIIGRFAHWLFVSRQLDSIFKYRFNVLEKLFTNNELVVRRSA